MLLEALFDITNDRLRDAYIDELRNRGKEKSAVYTKLKAWKDAHVGLGTKEERR